MYCTTIPHHAPSPIVNSVNHIWHLSPHYRQVANKLQIGIITCACPLILLNQQLFYEHVLRAVRFFALLVVYLRYCRML